MESIRPNIIISKNIFLLFVFLMAQVPLIFFCSISDGTVTVNYSDVSFMRHDGVVNCLAWAPNSTEIVSGGQDCELMIWKWNVSQERKVYSYHSDPILAVDWSPNGDHIASSTSGGKAKVWSPTTGTSEATFLGHYNANPVPAVNDVSWSPGGDRLASGSSNGVVRVWYWNMASPDDMEILAFGGHNDEVQCVAWSPDGSAIVSGGNDTNAMVWSSSSGASEHILSAHNGTVNAVSWSPDGDKIATGSTDCTARIWDANTGDEIYCFNGHEGSVNDVSWSPDGDKIASASDDGTIRIWSSMDGHEFVHFAGHSNRVNTVQWSGDKSKLVSSSHDLSVRVWLLEAPPTTPEVYFTQTTVKRGGAIGISAHSETYFETSDTLEATIEYRQHGSGPDGWTTQFFSNPVFVGDNWTVDFIPPMDAQLGYYDVRVSFLGTNGLHSHLKTLTKAFRVQNNLPLVESVQLPSSTYRLDEDVVGITISDSEDEPQDMIVVAQYSMVGAESWSADIFSTPMWDAMMDVWKYSFSFPATTIPGFYEFRIRCEDVDGGSSGWYGVPDSMEVLNCRPLPEFLTLTSSNIFRGESTLIWFGATDPENGIDVSSSEIEIRNASSDWNSLSVEYNSHGDNFSALYNTSSQHELGSHDVRVRVADVDGDFSSWHYYNNTFNVLNNPPTVDVNYTSFYLYNDRSEEFDLHPLVWDYEDDDDDLVWKILEVGTPLFSAVISNGRNLNITPASNESVGQASILLGVTDTLGDTSHKEVFIFLQSESECPHVALTLLSPLDQMLISNTSIQLNWALVHSSENPRNILYFGADPEDMSEIEILMGENSHAVSGLAHGTTYYWRVVTSFYGVNRVFGSPIWSFTVDMDFVAEHNIGLTVDRGILVEEKPGMGTFFNLTIKNDGNNPERIYLGVMGEFFSHTELEKYEIILQPEKEATIGVSVLWSGIVLRGDSLHLRADYHGHQSDLYIPLSKLDHPSSAIGSSGQGSSFCLIFFIILILVAIALAVLITVKVRGGKSIDNTEPQQIVIPSNHTWDPISERQVLPKPPGSKPPRPSSPRPSSPHPSTPRPSSPHPSTPRPSTPRPPPSSLPTNKKSGQKRLLPPPPKGIRKPKGMKRNMREDDIREIKKLLVMLDRHKIEIQNQLGSNSSIKDKELIEKLGKIESQMSELDKKYNVLTGGFVDFVSKPGSSP